LLVCWLLSNQDPERKRRQRVGAIEQTSDRIKIRSVSDGSAWGWMTPLTGGCAIEQTSDRIKIRSVSDGSAWGWMTPLTGGMPD
jgi:hypothetical protein